MDKFTKKYSSVALANAAEKAGYELSAASRHDRAEAARHGEAVPRWTLNKGGNQ